MINHFLAEEEYIKNTNFRMVPKFPTQLKALNNNLVELPGYYISVKAESSTQEFMLAAIPYDQCALIVDRDISLQWLKFTAKQRFRYLTSQSKCEASWY
jgi:hypothetical protein